jgi:hypothetical protein
MAAMLNMLRVRYDMGLGAASGGNELGSNPSCLWHTGIFSGLDYLFVFVLRDSRGYELPPLFLFGKGGTANFSNGFAHRFISFCA